MSSKPIFLLTHPRSVSTAFERVFVARNKDIVVIHEPFSDAYHWGPEKLSERYEDLGKWREMHGRNDYTYLTAMQIIDNANTVGKRVFVKDMAKCLISLSGTSPRIAPSLSSREIVPDETTGHREVLSIISNPTVIPYELLRTFHFAFLIRDPRLSIPSIYECSVPPKSTATGWHGFQSSDAGYKELRSTFDYLYHTGLIGPNSDNPICLIDSSDLLAYPKEITEIFCSLVGISFEPKALHWGAEDDQRRARELFKNWAPFHEVALQSTSLKSPSLQEIRCHEVDVEIWRERFGAEAASIIQKNIEDNLEDYLYLKQFAIKSPGEGLLQSMPT